MAVSKRYIIDASFVLSFLLPDEKHQHVDQVFNQYKDGTVELLSVPLLPFEVVNGLKLAVLRKRIDTKYALNRMKEFFDYKISLRGVDFFEAFEMAKKHSLTIYDACYLYQAQNLKTQLLTLDVALQKIS